jgi:predicted metal-dependent peptidase
MNHMNDVRQRLSAARAALVLDHPFFGALALRMAMEVEIKGRTRTMATDGRSIFYDKEFVKGCSDAELIGLLAHEVMHPAMQHHTRRGDRDPSLWNEAADHAINPILTEAGFTFSGDVPNEPQFRRMTAEQIYDALNRLHSGGAEDEDDQDDDRTAAGDPENGEGEGNGNDDGSENDDVGEDSNNDLANKPGAVLDAPDPAQQEAEWQVAVRQATQAAQMMGQLPSGMAQAVEQAMTPRIDWKALLRRFVQQFANADYSWRMPNRRYIAGGIYLPELRSESMPVIVVAVDTSASTSSVLPNFKAELQSIVDECQPEATIVIMADAAVQRVDRFERGDPIQFNVEGLGGTDFRPVFEWVERSNIAPVCLIYLTDLCCTSYPEVPDYPVLWVTDSRRTAPFGETIRISVD